MPKYIECVKLKRRASTLTKKSLSNLKERDDMANQILHLVEVVKTNLPSTGIVFDQETNNLLRKTTDACIRYKKRIKQATEAVMENDNVRIDIMAQQLIIEATNLRDLWIRCNEIISKHMLIKQA